MESKCDAKKNKKKKKLLLDFFSCISVFFKGPFMYGTSQKVRFNIQYYNFF